MTTFERLQRKIEKDTGKQLIRFHRTYAGGHAMEQGGYSWEAYWVTDKTVEYPPNKCPGLIVGSPYSATELLKAKKITYSHGCFFPED